MTTDQNEPQTAGAPGSPFVAPPFDPGRHTPEIRFYWWSWHPKYPTWSKSCWGGKTEAEAWDAYAKPGSKLDRYHNKLIREGDGQFTEVYDLPCQSVRENTDLCNRLSE